MKPQRVRIGCVQTEPTLGETVSNLDRVADLVRSAPPFDLLVLPELFSTGYLFRDREEAVFGHRPAQPR